MTLQEEQEQNEVPSFVIKVIFSSVWQDPSIIACFSLCVVGSAYTYPINFCLTFWNLPLASISGSQVSCMSWLAPVSNLMNVLAGSLRPGRPALPDMREIYKVKSNSLLIVARRILLLICLESPGRHTRLDNPSSTTYQCWRSNNDIDYFEAHHIDVLRS